MKKTLYAFFQSITLAVFIGLVVLLFVAPQSANGVVWTLVIPLVPVSLLIMGYSRWRNICPLAWFSKLTQNIVLLRKKRLPVWFEDNVYFLQFSLLFIAFAARLFVLNSEAMLLGGFFLAVIVLAALSGLLLSGKSWCNYLCPVGLVEKIYTGSNAQMQHIDSACGTCTACKINCPDIDMESSYWKEAANVQKRLVFYAFPGLVFGFYLYYYLEAGSWSYYFNGTWSLPQESFSLVSLLQQPGFFFLPQIPKLVAVPLTLFLSAAASYYTFILVELSVKKTRFAKGKDASTLEHITKVFAAFVAFNLFYLFAGAPTFQHYPYFYTAFHFLVILVSAMLFWREIYREEKFYFQERFARKILKKSKDETVLAKNLKEIYYTYSTQEKNHEKHLENYKETILELINDGILTGDESKMLDKIREQLGITAHEHKKIMKSLEKENAGLFEVDNSMTAEKLFQLKSYKSMLQKALEENKALSEEELEKMRKHFQIENKEHEKILNELMNADGLLKEKIHAAMNELLSLYKINALIPENSGIAANYLKFNVIQEIKEQLQSLENVMPLLCTNVNIGRLIHLLHAEPNSDQDISWVEASFKPLVEELLHYKEKEAPPGSEGLKEAAACIFANRFDALVPALLHLLLTENMGDSFKEEIERYVLSEESVTSEIARLLLRGENAMSLVHIAALLHAVEPFNTLLPDHVEMLAQNVTIRSYAAGEYIVRQGNEGEVLYILSKGSAKVLINTPEGEKEIADIFENDYIGEIALFSGEKRTASVKAMEAVESLELTAEMLKRVIYYSPGISFEMMRQMTIRILEHKRV